MTSPIYNHITETPQLSKCLYDKIASPAVAKCLFAKAMATPDNKYYTYQEEAVRELAIHALLRSSPEPIESLFQRAAKLPDMAYMLEDCKTNRCDRNDTYKTIYLARMLSRQKRELITSFIATVPLKANL